MKAMRDKIEHAVFSSVDVEVHVHQLLYGLDRTVSNARSIEVASAVSDVVLRAAGDAALHAGLGDGLGDVVGAESREALCLYVPQASLGATYSSGAIGARFRQTSEASE